ncbi:MAG: glutamate-cysteine ligase family protein [bacterium]|nr:glutamate-cysteine ligase family protein [bacterium]
MTESTPWSYPRKAFSCTGVELEYMVVDRESMNVRPIVDELFKSITGSYDSDIPPSDETPNISWSNELALHVVELKTDEPVERLEGLAAGFQANVDRVNAQLEQFGAHLLPGAVHPWMDPIAEMRLWPHEANPIYEAFDKIFNCKGHGWANLQSTHINLPFSNEEEFGRLHAAIRMVLPLIPALAASSPILDGRWSPIADQRLEVYRRNSVRIPEAAGLVIPEPVFTRADYEQSIFQPLYTALRPHDPEGILQHEWANSRGCIARFMRGSIEIRVVDIQECPAADLAVVALITAAVKAMYDERWISYEEQKSYDVKTLHEVLLDTIRYAERTRIMSAPFLRAFGWTGSTGWAGDMWVRLFDELLADDTEFAPTLRKMLAKGTLSSRMNQTIGRYPDRSQLKRITEDLSACLAEGRLYGC